MLGNAREWLRERSTIDPQALNKGLPKGVGWWNTLGSTALMLLAVEAVTGIVLAMYYSPHPDAAYETVQFIDRQLPMGRLVRGIHRYADSALIIVLGLHLLRTFFHGAYKRPRELTWVFGLLALNVVVLFGFTGYLLPWDQNGFFGARARTGYFSEIPVVGPMVSRLLLGGPDIGAMTLTRFYAIHAVLLPAILLTMIQAHLVLVWRKGPTPPGARVGETVPAASRFLDDQVFKAAVVALGVFAVVYLMAWFRPVEAEFKANPADPTYQPRAEWYFLSLFQLVKNFQELFQARGMSWIPAVVIPGLGMTFLALLPWIDRSPERRASKRPFVVGAMLLGLTGLTALTVQAMVTLRPNATPSNSLYGAYTDHGRRDLDPRQVAQGKELFRTAKPLGCSSCHKAYSDYDQGGGPDLSGYGLRSFLRQVAGNAHVERLSFHQRFVQYVRGDLRPRAPDGTTVTKMPNYPADQLSDAELDAIGAYLSQDPAKAEIRHANPRLTK
jgi:ubiquinol-cytochrome c reductase cytochrome b subunit